MDKTVLTQKIKDKALQLGFAKVGITTADDFDEFEEDLHSRGKAYAWMFTHFPSGPTDGIRPRDLMPEAKSIVCVAYDFSQIDYPENLLASIGRTYLSNGYLPKPDSLNGSRLELFHKYLEELGCAVFDKGPQQCPDRWAAARAGIVTFGGNNMAYAEGCGSFVNMFCFIIDKELDYDSPSIERPCPPDCRLCIDACPTNALTEQGKMIPSRCISFHTFGMSGYVKEEIRIASGSRIHGCDACQEACPRNKKALEAPKHKSPFLEKISREFDLEKVLLMDDDYFERVVFPIMGAYTDAQVIYDAKEELFPRSAAIALGNSQDESHVPALEKALGTRRKVVREASAWALGRIGGEKAKEALLRCSKTEDDPELKQAIEEALGKIKSEIRV
ncbi:MAG: epoxyqueuosine reductase [Clostridiales bacterium]|nr:epoxyqueuosine reductase [Clostridiales bacterium]